ncbi:MAG: hypothetical protein ACI4S3_00325, partial [Candidatus Gastranaerophilaceae bacterium]
MLLNRVLDILHKPMRVIYESSVILKCIDSAILVSILLTFILSSFLSSDVIGCLCLSTLILTIVRIITNPEDSFKCEKFELFLLAYFMISIISVAGSTLLPLSIKGFSKTFLYLGFYFSVVHHLKNNRKNI